MDIYSSSDSDGGGAHYRKKRTTSELSLNYSFLNFDLKKIVKIS
ncbi:hypothetical protein SAMN02745941_00828 [Clostridium intestinale DSM 6191]|uniref:Uncharacterized protein n=1 Tax=Clostridium intestinale DSM 6191 TaxID=1121320 RepID=A0A1M5VWP8_9CLOT|nr:hypothetical protein SAMN02745941_00828 [Clostridium intestinale DSM 6191]